jgi:hypothetical protein
MAKATASHPGPADQNCTANLLVRGAVFRRAKSKTIIIFGKQWATLCNQYRAIRHDDDSFIQFST